MAVSPNAIVGVFRVVARLLPPTPLEQVTSLSLEELKQKFRQRDRWVNIVAGFFVVALAVAYFFLLTAIANWHYAKLGDVKYFIDLGPVVLGIFAAFLSLASAYCVVLVALRCYLGKDEYLLYTTYQSHNSAQGIDPIHGPKMMFWMLGLICVPLAICTALSVDYYTAFKEHELVDNSWLSWGVERIHPYTAVRGVYEIRGIHARFEDTEAPYYLIRFTDGAEWQTQPGSRGPKIPYERDAIHFVAAQSGKPLQLVNFVEDIVP